MTNYAKNQIKKMKEYNPPLSGRRNFEGLCLDFNERTIPVSVKVLQALKSLVDENKLQFYPEYFDLTEKIAGYANVKKNQIMITNGSDQGIDLIFRTFTDKEDKVIIPSPSFAMFYQCAQIAGNNIVMPQYREDMSFPLEEVLKEIDKKTKLIVLCNPNNPTGTFLNLREIEKILKKARKVSAIVFVDEAYFEFCRITAVPFLEKYSNLIITRTFSKAFGLASLRIGYVISQKENLRQMQKVRGPYDVNMAACFCAYSALDDLGYLYGYVDEVMNESKVMMEEFFEKNNIKYFPSGGNFIFFKPKNPKKIFSQLKKNGLLLRPMKDKRFLRVTIGTKDQMTEFIKIYNKIL